MRPLLLQDLWGIRRGGQRRKVEATYLDQRQIKLVDIRLLFPQTLFLRRHLYDHAYDEIANPCTSKGTTVRRFDTVSIEKINLAAVPLAVPSIESGRAFLRSASQYTKPPTISASSCILVGNHLANVPWIVGMMTAPEYQVHESMSPGAPQIVLKRAVPFVAGISEPQKHCIRRQLL